MPYKFGNLTVYRLGEEGSGTVLRSGDGIQDFEQIQSELAGTGQLFEDPEFPLSPDLLKAEDKSPDDVFYLRPHDIQKKGYKSDAEVLFKTEEGGDDSDICRFDIRQGGIGDCGALASFATCVTHVSVKNVLFPEGNTLGDGKYTGAFHFRIHWMGRWLDVVCDDRIPVNKKNKPHGVGPIQCGSTAEYWPCILEKLWGKMANTFDGQWMGGGIKHVHALTGGIYEDFPVREDNAFEEIKKFASRDGVSGLCSFPKDNNLGLVSGHAYSLTAIEKIETIDGESVELLRWRNPWGHKEYVGSWSDGSSEWGNVSQEVKDRLGLVVRDDGEFWMKFSDFAIMKKAFELTHLIPQELDDDRELLGQYAKYHGKWGQEHVDNYWSGPTKLGNYYFRVDKPHTRALFAFMAFGIKYGGDQTKSENSGALRLFRVGEPGISDDEAAKGIIGAKVIKSANVDGHLGRDFSPKAVYLDPGTYAVSVCVTKVENPPYDEFLLRIYWDYN